MQTTNLNFPIVVLGRDIKITPAIRYYAISHIRRVHLDYPRITDAKVTCWREHHEVVVSISFRCADHIHIEAKAHGLTVEAGIDLAFDKAERQMRKRNTRRLQAQQEPAGVAC
ncbi:MAG: hypothetical protein GWQ05_09965 [Verrucomicrobiaceae bacterium]|nr:hypothetical protein [Verrucomicrobiaceae bacterium]NCF91268.1 hypothetical protein [Verrucomicrobiaceae bacterium]